MRTTIAWLLAACLAASGAAASPLPVEVADGQWQPLRSQVDRRLQQQLEKGLRSAGNWSKLIRQRKLAVALVDLSDPARPRFARVNGNTMMYAASLPKIAILLAAVDAVESGRLQLDADVDRDLNEMIRRSSNGAATRTIDRLGGLAKVNEILQDPRFDFYDENRGGGLWVGKRYAKKGKRIPDPVNGISHGATATQVARFYYRMATGRLISHKGSQRMLEYMTDPRLKHKFVKPLSNLAPQASLYRKSGTWRHWHADSVLVWGPEWRRYILVAMVEHPDGEKIVQSLVPVAETALRSTMPSGKRGKP